MKKILLVLILFFGSQELQAMLDDSLERYAAGEELFPAEEVMGLSWPDLPSFLEGNKRL